MTTIAPLKRIALNFVNAAEDVPRLIRAYGKAGGAEFSLVLRPHDASGVLVRADKQGGVHVWQAASSGDGPFTPNTLMGTKEALALITGAQKNLSRTSPITLRGQWGGKLDIYADGQVSVELSRKVASYGTLHISSTGDGTWTWRVQRGEKWFSSPQEAKGSRSKTLSEAISTGLAHAMGLLGEACSVRDSRRRSAYDQEWAATHPIKPAKEGKDPTAKFEPKEPKPAKEPKPPKEPKPAKEPKAPKEPKASKEAKPPKEPKEPRKTPPRKKPADAPAAAPVSPIDPFGAPQGYPAAVPAGAPGMTTSAIPAPNAAMDQMLMDTMLKQLQSLDLSKLV